MTRRQLNLVIDTLALVALAALLLTGALIHWRLPHGSPGQGLTMLGLDRHDWGEIHFIAAIAFVVLMVVHVWMHWRWCWSMIRGENPASRRLRTAVFVVVVVLLIAALASPWLMRVEQTRPGGRGGGSARGTEHIDHED
jgi:uncharacterized protein DUF4405